MVDISDKRLQKLLTRWEEVEGAIKRAEMLQGQVTLPAINELRYAGRQLLVLLKTLSSSPTEETSRHVFEKAITNAEQYVTNADHDVTDSVVVFIGRRFEELNGRFGRKAIEQRCEGYSELGDLLVSCRFKVEESRRDVAQRDRLYDEMKEEALQPLIDSWRTLVNADVIMAAEIGLAESRAASEHINSAIKNVIIGALSVLLCLVTFMKHWFG